MFRVLAARTGINVNLAGRYVLAGILASAINFLSRFAMSQALPFEWAVLAAQGIGFTAGFLLYRNWVFLDARTRLPRQLAAFTGVNLFSSVIVLGCAISLRSFLASLDFPIFEAEALAHAGGIASGAIFNFLGHRILTFARNAIP